MLTMVFMELCFVYVMFVFNLGKWPQRIVVCSIFLVF